MILLCLALDNPSVIDEFMGKLIPTEHFKSEIGLVMDAVHDSIRKPLAPCISAIRNDALPSEARYNAIRIAKEIGGERVVQVLKEAVGNEDKKLALLAFEVLESLGISEGVVKPTVKEAPARLINPMDKSEMVLISAGTFLYGSREDDPVASSDEKPQRVIDLHAFYMDVYPVTNEQYRNLLQTMKPDKDTSMKWIRLKDSSQEERCRIKKDDKDYTIEKGYERHPVIYVTWFGAGAYAKWAGKRLPTEQEWEKAARGPDGRVYPWGDKFGAALCNSAESGIGETTEVGKFLKGKSYYGCYDMAGNVWEWTDSWYEKEECRVVRGGSWSVEGYFCRCAYHNYYDPGDRDFNVGFRCARTLKL